MLRQVRSRALRHPLLELVPALATGAVAALLGSTLLAAGEGDAPLGTWFLVAGALLFGASCGATLFAPLAGWLTLPAVLAGAAAGITSHALVHAALLGGSRTLWPIEVVLFVALGLLPAVLGHLLGRLLRPRTAPARRGAR